MSEQIVREAMEAVFAASRRDQGINTSDGVRALANAMFTLCRHGDAFTERQLIDNLALLTGMGCAALLEYADRLEAEDQ